MALQNYNLSWSDSLISRVETHLRDVHSALTQYFERQQYETEVEIRSAATAAGAASARGDEENGAAAAAAAAATPVDAISPAGSFLLRTCVYDTPFPQLHAQRGVGADLVVSIPVSRCSAADLQEGRYLECRQAFLEEVQTYLDQLARGAAKRTASATATSSSEGAEMSENANAGESEDDDDDDDADDDSYGGTALSKKKGRASHKNKTNAAAAARLSRMEISVAPIHGCYALAGKNVLKLRFRRRHAVTATAAAVYETFFIHLHFRPSVSSGRTVNAAAVRKHPYYSYAILEDYLMPHYLKKLHEVCVASANVRRAIVVLKCWAHHTGLMSAASGHPEGLNGFVVAAMVLRLLEEGILTAGMSLDNMVRAVWVQLSRGFFVPTMQEAAAGRPSKVSAAEEQGQMSVLRFAGEVHNILFRTSASFFQHAVGPAAEEALQHPFAMEVVDRMAFQPLALRFDVALTVRLQPAGTETDAETARQSEQQERAEAAAKKSGQWQAPRVEAIEASLRVLREALGVRASYTTAWQTDDDHLQVVVQLTSESEGRNRLTRGPAIEDAAAVERFNTFWGVDLTSTRQFSDGAIYRCVLWTFAEEKGTNTTVALSASAVLRRVVEFALRKHVAKTAEVRVLLGGLEGYLAERIGAEWRDAAPLMQRSLLDATKAVQHMLQNLPHGSVPCRIVSFDVVAASERHTEVFPVRPHLALTFTTDKLQDPAFAALSTASTIEPINCVLSIDDNHKIPDTMEAIGMMKGAIAAQLAKTLQAHFGETNNAVAESGATSGKKQRKHGGSGSKSGGGARASNSEDEIVRGAIRTQCTNQSVDIIYRGYLFRVYIAHYREVSLLRALQRDTEANVLEMKLYWTAQHAKFMKTIAFGHHSYSHAVRLAKRWMSAMYLYEFVQPEAVELLVANAYLQPTHTPKTPAGGFLRFVQLLASHDWTTPLVLPFTDDDSDKTAVAAAELVRKLGDQQGMFIATPYAPAASPFTVLTPRPMIMGRLVQLAQSVVAVLLHHLEGHKVTEGEVEAFTANPSAFDFEVQFHPRLVLQPDRALHIPQRPVRGDASAQETAAATSLSTEEDAAAAAAAANALVRIWQLDELDAATSSREYINQLVEREPAAHAVRMVRAALRERGMMFYDALAPSSLHVVGITAQRQLGKSQQLHAAILKVARGALLPAPLSAFVADATFSAEKRAHPCGCGHEHGDGEGHAHHPKAKQQHGHPRGGSAVTKKAGQKGAKVAERKRDRSGEHQAKTVAPLQKKATEAVSTATADAPNGAARKTAKAGKPVKKVAK